MRQLAALVAGGGKRWQFGAMTLVSGLPSAVEAAAGRHRRSQRRLAVVTAIEVRPQKRGWRGLKVLHTIPFALPGGERILHRNSEVLCNFHVRPPKALRAILRNAIDAVLAIRAFRFSAASLL